ncbi:MAG: hypothetical protein AAB551_03360, partial [Patescibacteria group bacterium]
MSEQPQKIVDTIRSKETEIKKASGNQQDIVREEEIQAQAEQMVKTVKDFHLPSDLETKTLGEFTQMLDRHDGRIKDIKDLKADALKVEFSGTKIDLGRFEQRPDIKDRVAILVPLNEKKASLSALFGRTEYQNGTHTALQLTEDFKKVSGFDASQIIQMQNLLGVPSTAVLDAATFGALSKYLQLGTSIKLQASPEKTSGSPGTLKLSPETLAAYSKEFFDANNLVKFNSIVSNTWNYGGKLDALLAKPWEDHRMEIQNLGVYFSPDAEYPRILGQEFKRLNDQYALLKSTLTDPDQISRIDATMASINKAMIDYSQYFKIHSDRVKDYFKSKTWVDGNIESQHETSYRDIDNARQSARQTISRMNLAEAIEWVTALNKEMDDHSHSEELEKVQQAMLTECKNELRAKMIAEQQDIQLIRAALSSESPDPAKIKELQEKCQVFQKNCLQLALLFSDKGIPGMKFDIDSNYRDMGFAREAALNALDYNQLLEDLINNDKLLKNDDPWIEENRSALEAKKKEISQLPPEQQSDPVNQQIVSAIDSGLSNYKGLSFRKQLEVSASLRAILQVPQQAISETISSMVKSKSQEMQKYLAQISTSFSLGTYAQGFSEKTGIKFDNNVRYHAFNLLGDLNGFGALDFSGENEMFAEMVTKMAAALVTAILIMVATLGAAAPGAIAGLSLAAKSAIAGIAMTASDALIFQKGFEGGFGGFLEKFGPRGLGNTLAMYTGLKVGQYAQEISKAYGFVSKLQKAGVVVGETVVDITASTAIAMTGEVAATPDIDYKLAFEEGLKSGLVLAGAFLGLRPAAGLFQNARALKALHDLGHSEYKFRDAGLREKADLARLVAQAEKDPTSLNYNQWQALKKIADDIPLEAMEGDKSLFQKVINVFETNRTLAESVKPPAPVPGPIPAPVPKPGPDPVPQPTPKPDPVPDSIPKPIDGEGRPMDKRQRRAAGKKAARKDGTLPERGKPSSAKERKDQRRAERKAEKERAEKVNDQDGEKIQKDPDAPPGIEKRTKTLENGSVLTLEGTKFDPATGHILEGKVTRPDGSVEKGTFSGQNGRLIEGETFFPDGRLERKGRFDPETRKLIEGTRVFSDGTSETGHFNKEGQLHGDDCKMVVGERTLEGKFENGKLVEGKVTFPDGTFTRYENGKPLIKEINELSPEEKTLMKEIFPDGLEKSEMRQGARNGNCYLVASMDSLRKHPLGEYIISKMIKKVNLPDGSSGWEVRFPGHPDKPITLGESDLHGQSFIDEKGSFQSKGAVDGAKGYKILERAFGRLRKQLRNDMAGKTMVVGEGGFSDEVFAAFLGDLGVTTNIENIVRDPGKYIWDRSGRYPIYWTRNLNSCTISP